MLRRVRRKFRRIHYHSAARPRTVWTRAFDWAMVGSLLAALPITWLCNLLIVRSSVVVEKAGHLSRAEDGRVVAILFDSKDATPVNSTPIGNLHLLIKDIKCGWPWTTSIRTPPAQLDIDIVHEPKPRTNVMLAADDPLRISIEATLAAHNEMAALNALDRDHDLVHHHWLSWMVGAWMWWIMLMLASSSALFASRIATQVWLARRAIRKASLRAQGKCLICGYDMTGLEFNERCPECGELVW